MQVNKFQEVYLKLPQMTKEIIEKAGNSPCNFSVSTYPEDYEN